jgi:hypothetical protein
MAHFVANRCHTPVAVAKFELGEDDEAREARALRQRQASDVIQTLRGGISFTE